MNKEQLQNLLNQKYDAANWNKIYGSIFPNVMLFSSPKEIAVTENWVKSFKQRGLVRLQGNQDVAIFEVVLKDGISVQSKRVGLRNLVAKLIDEYQNHGVLAVFDNGSPEYRFTFAAKETKVTREGIEKTETDSKRYTYILGETETCKTAAEQFIKLSEKGSAISLSDLQEAFSVEKLSKQFFDDYKVQYKHFVSYLKSQPKILKSVFADDEKKMRDFVKLLLGRLVFLRFVQKKRWLGVPAKNTDWSSGDVKFLVNTYKAFSKKEKYYSDFLEELFFECLNSPNRKNELFSITGTKVPFLNGGLFENDNPKTKSINFPVSYFDGLFDFFGRYNFTIDENDPTEKEVGIDPEMLGSIFENLLEDNKDKGAFYTPKEIVHYMCQESLIEYLCTKVNVENDEKVASSIRNLITKRKIDECVTGLIKPIAVALREVKICDPAIGSGAFPMGMLMEIFHCVFELYNADPKVVSKEWNMNGWQANVVKSNIIQNSIYGVDIEKGAVDIARLRFWLSLIVDEEEPKALPNLDYKIVVGNSLVSKLGNDIIDIDWEVKANTEAAKKLQQEIQNNLNKLFKTQKVFFDFNGKKENLKEEIRNLKIDVLISQLQLDKYKYLNSSAQIGSLFEITAKEKTIEQARKQKLEAFDKTILELQKLKIYTDHPLNFFDWKLDFPEVMNEQVTTNVGFDIVIANPPYVDYRKIDIDTKMGIQKYSVAQFSKMINLYTYFIELSFSLLKLNGNIALITPQQYLISENCKGVRDLLRRYYVIKLSDFSKLKLFEAATYTFVSIFKKLESNGKSGVYNEFDSLINLKRPVREIQVNNPLDEPYSSSDHMILLKKIESINTYRLGSFIKIFCASSSTQTTSNTKNKGYYRYLQASDIFEYSIQTKECYINKSGYSKSSFHNQMRELVYTSRMTNTIRAVLVDNSDMLGGKINALYSINPRIENHLILAILNSKLINFWYRERFNIQHLQGGALPINTSDIELIPMPLLNFNQSIIKSMVNKITTLKKQKKNTTEIEQRLNSLIFRIYHVSYDEVKVIDPAFELSKEEFEKIELE